MPPHTICFCAYLWIIEFHSASHRLRISNMCEWCSMYCRCTAKVLTASHFTTPPTITTTKGNRNDFLLPIFCHVACSQCALTHFQCIAICFIVETYRSVAMQTNGMAQRSGSQQNKANKKKTNKRTTHIWSEAKNLERQSICSMFYEYWQYGSRIERATDSFMHDVHNMK